MTVRALVVYESMFGNTRDVALAVADGIGSLMPVEVMEVAAAPAAIPADVGLLVVGGPTHAHGLTSTKSRADAAKRAGDRLVSRGIGLDEWIGGLPSGPASVVTATFDTRIKGPELLWGSAAKEANKRLAALRYRVIAPPESFLIGGPTGPAFDRLGDGELERASAWGASLAAAIAVPAT